ncbi:MAG: hypothetical protein FGM24_02430 [Candidatus Kapabacteria bacterium]|nr:hypothetical protein [Candidatus Kapabacteria bacterium]
MKMLRTLTLILAVAFMATGCEQREDSFPIDDLKLHKDDVRMFEVMIPSNWFSQKVPGQLVVAYPTKDMATRFQTFGKGRAGAKIELRVMVVDSTRTVDSVVANSKLEFVDGIDRYKVEPTTFGGKPGKKVWVEFGQEDGKFRSETYVAEQDSVITVLTLAAFGGTFGDYEAEFGKILASVKLATKELPAAPKVDTAAPTGPEPPSDTLRMYSAPEFTIQIPQNFQGTKGKSSGLSSMSFAGSRLDCTIQVDVFDASKQKNLDKIADQNKATYGGSDPKSTTISGSKAVYFSYNPNAQVAARAYYTVKGDRMFRVTVNWYKPEQAVYLPIFEKCVASLSLK